MNLKCFAYLLFFTCLGLPAKSFSQIVPLNDTLQEVGLDSWELNEARWERVQDLDGRFSLEIPAPLQTKVDSVETDIGYLVQYTKFFQPQQERAENVLYMISYWDFPEGSVHSDSTELLMEFFDATLDEATYTLGGELLYASDTQNNNYPGKIWRIDYRNGNVTVRTRAFVAGSRYYAVQTISHGALRLNSSSDRFLDSFRIY